MFELSGRTNEKGFTLIEILIVLSVIAILLVVANSMFSSFARNRNLKEAAGALMSDIKLAKQKAMSEGVAYTITINNEDSYTLQNGSPKFLNQYGEGIKIKQHNFSGNTINFQPRGTSSMGTIVLQNDRGSEIRIICGQTGRIRSEEKLK
ncbi:MAG TPA: type II secretion system protein [Smithella sp.]|nr:type II secretion system protein [Smithella sp.]HRS97522.1 type II secretion system protein [Smithella sp.]